MKSITAKFLISLTAFALVFGIAALPAMAKDSKALPVRNPMAANYLYVSVNEARNDNPTAVFYMTYTGELISDLPWDAQIVSVTATENGIRVIYNYQNYQHIVPAYKTPFKIGDVPIRSLMHPFNGLGIVTDRAITYLYDEESGRITIFDLYSGKTTVAKAIRSGESVQIKGGASISLKKGIVESQTYRDVNGFDYDSYLPNLTN